MKKFKLVSNIIGTVIPSLKGSDTDRSIDSTYEKDENIDKENFVSFERNKNDKNNNQENKIQNEENNPNNNNVDNNNNNHNRNKNTNDLLKESTTGVLQENKNILKETIKSSDQKAQKSKSNQSTEISKLIDNQYKMKI